MGQQQSASLLYIRFAGPVSSQSAQHHEHVATAGPASMTGAGYEDSMAAALLTACFVCVQGGPALDKLASACAAVTLLCFRVTDAEHIDGHPHINLTKQLVHL